MAEKHVFSLFFLILLFIPQFLSAQITFMPGEPEIDDLRSIYQEAGKLFPTTDFPLSKDRLAAYAENLRRKAVPPHVQELLDEYLEALDYAPDQLTLSVPLRLTYEHYFRTKEEWLDFNRLFTNLDPFFDVRMSFAKEDKAGFDVYALLEREYWGFSMNNLFESREGNPMAVENRLVRKGYLWYNFDPLSVVFGRNGIHLGPLRNSIMPSSNLPFIDNIRLKLPLGPISMDLTIATLEHREASGSGDVDLTDTGYTFYQNLIFLAIHRFELSLDFLRIGVAGQCLYVREKNGFTLADFFPVFSWHQSDIRPNNMCLVVDADAVLFPGFRIMAQYGFDDINAAATGSRDEPIPTIDAGIFGVEYTNYLPFGLLSLYAEAGFTHYLWGNYENDHALGRAMYRIALDGGTRYLPLTSPYGPGTVWINTEAGLLDWFGFSSSVYVNQLFENPAAELTISYEESKTVQTTPMIGTTIIGMNFDFHGIKYVTFTAEPAIYIREDSTWMEFTLGVSAHIEPAAHFHLKGY